MNENTTDFSKYERGPTSRPLETPARIARTLEVSLDYLLTWKTRQTEKLGNAKLVERIEEARSLPLEYQETIDFCAGLIYQATQV